MTHDEIVSTIAGKKIADITTVTTKDLSKAFVTSLIFTDGTSFPVNVEEGDPLTGPIIQPVIKSKKEQPKTEK
jgi:hypothetical protein